MNSPADAVLIAQGWIASGYELHDGDVFETFTRADHPDARLRINRSRQLVSLLSALYDRAGSCATWTCRNTDTHSISSPEALRQSPAPVRLIESRDSVMLHGCAFTLRVWDTEGGVLRTPTKPDDPQFCVDYHTEDAAFAALRSMVENGQCAGGLVFAYRGSVTRNPSTR